MRIVGVSSSVSTLTRQFTNEACDTDASEAQERALITIECPRQDEHSPRLARPPSAPFVAHLLATRMQAPQTRKRSRAEPGEATAVYRSMTKPVMGSRMFRARV